MYTELRFVVLIAGYSKSNSILIAKATSSEGVLVDGCGWCHRRWICANCATCLENPVARMACLVGVVLATEPDVQQSLAIGDYRAV